VSNRATHALLGLSIVAAAAVLIRRFDQGWFENDDGSFAHEAERILAGELPHRDFAELYTGLLSFVNAGVFALLGHDIVNLRIPLFVLFLAFAACYFSLARRLVEPVAAFVATLFAITWSVPIYPAPMPSWYQLFLATFGIYALVRNIESGDRRWLVAAGALGGTSILMKIVGVWYVAAVVLFLLVRPSLDAQRRDDASVHSPAYAVVVGTVAALTLAAVLAVMLGGLGPGEFVGLFIPVAALCAAVAISGGRSWVVGTPALRVALTDVAGFVLGVMVPIGCFAGLYIVKGGLGALVDGVLIAPQARFEHAAFSMPDPLTLLRAIPVLALFGIRFLVSVRWRRLVDVAACSVIVYLVLTATDGLSYSVLWSTTRSLAPFVVLLGALALLIPARSASPVQREMMVAIVLVAGFWTLVQFPFATPVYFCYAIPLLLLAAVAALRHFGAAGGLLPIVLLLALTAFGARQLDRQALNSLGVDYSPDPGVELIDADRASIRVVPQEKQAYDRVRELVAGRSTPRSAIFAGPDSPEIYFLTQRVNFTPAILDFLDRSGTTRNARLLQQLKANGVRVVVLNHMPRQSPRLGTSMIDDLRSLYPHGRRAGRFEVRWRGRVPS
jgi:hypothetical protein